MKNFIDIFGQNNIIIVLAVILAVIVALIIIIIIEKTEELKEQKQNNEVLPYVSNNIDTNNLSYNEVEEDSITNEEYLQPLEKIGNQPILEEKSSNSDVVYVEKKETPEDAKKAIEEAAKKLAYEEQHQLSGPTYFEKEQEEKSIISYDELIKSNIDVDQANADVLEDEGNEPITIDELYKSQLKDVINETTKKEVPEQKENVPIDIFSGLKKEDITMENKKFKNSEVISPVFGVKRDTVYQKEYNDLGETVNIKELDSEIAKTEDLLTELKKLKDKLD